MVAIKKTDHAKRVPWTPGKYDVVCSAHFKDIGFTVSPVAIIMLDIFQG
jgi:hypothetical protein